MQIHLRDINPEIVSAWQAAFADIPEVAVSLGDILEHRADAIVSPANSFGYMDGGVDLVYSKFFGWELEANLRARLTAQHYGELPVGQALLLATGHKEIPYLLSAPTMRVPGSIGNTVNVYLAFRAALIAVQQHNGSSSESAVHSLLVPGFGTGVGNMPAPRAAQQMRQAYDAVIGGQGVQKRSARQILNDHLNLLA